MTRSEKVLSVLFLYRKQLRTQVKIHEKNRQWPFTTMEMQW